jgi:hypothetical protein
MRDGEESTEKAHWKCRREKEGGGKLMALVPWSVGKSGIDRGAIRKMR